MRWAAAIVLALCLLPALALAALSVGDAGYREILAQERQATLLWRSVRVSAGATLLALLWGAAVAWGVRGLKGWAGALLETLSMAPLLLPSIVIAMGWIFFCGTTIDLYTETGAAFVLSMCTYPCVSILLLQGLRNLDPTWLAAARLHAGRLRAIWFVARPLLSPYVATGALLVFLLSLGDYGVPSALRVNVYPVEIFAQMSAYYDVPRSVAFCVPPLAIAVAVVLARRLLVRPIGETIGHRSHATEARPTRAGVVAAVVVVIAGVVLPLGALAATLRSSDRIPEALSVAGEQALNSLAVSALSTPLLLAAGAVLARGRLAGALVALPLVIPGAVVGLGIVVLYARGWMPRAIYAGPLVLAYASLCRLITFPTLILAASFGAIRPRMTEAAEVCGVGRARTTLRVTLPLAMPGVVGAAAVSFLFCLGELSASALVSPPGWMTLPVRIASLLHFGEDRLVAALCLTLAALGVGFFTLALLLMNRRLELRLRAD